MGQPAPKHHRFRGFAGRRESGTFQEFTDKDNVQSAWTRFRAANAWEEYERLIAAREQSMTQEVSHG